MTIGSNANRRSCMPITVALFSLNIGGRDFAFDTPDISFGDGNTKDVERNIGSDILKFTLRKRQVTLTIRGATKDDIEGIYAELENNINRLLNANGPVAGTNIVIGADTIENAILLSVQSGPPITIGGVPVIEQVQVRYDSQSYTV